jgi:hypothetical protein
MARFYSTYLLGYLMILAVWSTCQATCSIADLTLDEQLDEIKLVRSLSSSIIVFSLNLNHLCRRIAILGHQLK